MSAKSKLYALKDKEGTITALSEQQVTAEWQPVNLDDDQVKAFAARNANAGSSIMEATDLQFIRVLEDLIELLIDKQVIKFTEFPAAAQKKMLNRKWYRSAIRQQGADDLLENEENLF